MIRTLLALGLAGTGCSRAHLLENTTEPVRFDLTEVAPGFTVVTSFSIGDTLPPPRQLNRVFHNIEADLVHFDDAGEEAETSVRITMDTVPTWQPEYTMPPGQVTTFSSDLGGPDCASDPCASTSEVTFDLTEGDLVEVTVRANVSVLWTSPGRGGDLIRDDIDVTLELLDP